MAGKSGLTDKKKRNRPFEICRNPDYGIAGFWHSKIILSKNNLVKLYPFTNSLGNFFLK